MLYCFNFRENGLSEICVLIEDAKDAKIGQLEEEKSDLSRSLLKKIPECPVNIKIYFTKYPFNILFVIARSVLNSSRKTSPSSAVWLDIISVDPARPRRPSR